MRSFFIYYYDGVAVEGSLKEFIYKYCPGTYALHRLKCFDRNAANGSYSRIGSWEAILGDPVLRPLFTRSVH